MSHRLVHKSSDIVSGDQFLAEIEEAFQLVLGSGGEDTAMNFRLPPHVAPDTQFVALGADIVSEAPIWGELKASAVDVDELELQAELTGVGRIGRPRRK